MPAGIETSSSYGELNRGVGVSFGKKKKAKKKPKVAKKAYMTYG